MFVINYIIWSCVALSFDHLVSKYHKAKEFTEQMKLVHSLSVRKQ